MKLVLDDYISEELREYLKMQEGINDVIFNKKDNLTILDIKHNNKINPNIIMKNIEIF